jgi:tetratricopeptide (TPR) repeat protein
MTSVRPGERLADRYEILGELGRGGMGAVFEAHDTVLERKVALKVVTGAGALSSHFEHEAKLAAKLDHPAIVPVYDFGRDGDRLFFVMPIVEGLTLRQMLADGPLPQIVAAIIVRQVAEALAHSHARSVVHRDIKPENVMVAPGTDGPRVKVLDFGIAASTTEAASGTPRQIVGTPDYLSPEQASGGPVDARSDVYALGALLYECCAGTPPFVAPDVFQVIQAILRSDPPSLAERCPGVDADVDDVVRRCLAKDPRQRPESAERVVELLASVTARLRPASSPDRGAVSHGRTVEVHSTLPAAPRIVGRQSELTRVRSRLASAAAGECQLIAIGGSYGVGKSAFVSVVSEAAREWGMLVLRGRFLVEDDDVAPYQAISDALAGFFRSTIDGEDRFKEPDLLPQLVGLFPELRGIVRLPESATPKAPRAKRAETFELLSRALAALMGRSPSDGREPASREAPPSSMLLVLEDIHSARTSIDAVRYMIRRLAAAPLAIVITHRAGDADPEHPLFELRSALLGEPSFLDLELRPLDRAESDALAATLLPGAKVDPAAAARLFELTEGNPLHLAELTTTLREGGLLRVDLGAWQLAATPGDAAVPPVPASMRSVVERRLLRLSPAERAVLEAGAIFGRSFTYEDVAALGVPMIDAALDRLIRGGLVHRETAGSRDRYVFTAVIVAETAREALGPGKRRELHKRFGEHLIAHGRTTGAEATRIVHHLMLAGERAQALPHAVRAASHALDVSVPEDVFYVAGLVGEPAGNLTAAEIELLLLVARAHGKTKNVDRGRAAAARAVALLEQTRLHDRQHKRRNPELDNVEVAALRQAAELAWRERERDEALDLARRARAMASALGRDDEVDAINPLVNAIEGPAGREAGRSDAGDAAFLQAPPLEQELLGERLLVQGDYLAARELLDRADARRPGTPSPEDAARHALKSALLAHRLGSYDEAELVARSARQRVTEGPLAGEIDAAVALVHCSRGRYENAWSLVQAAIETLGVSLSERRVRALLLRAKGDASMGLGRLVDATDAYDQSGRLLDPLADSLEHSAALFGSGDARIAAGKPDEGVRFLEKAERQKLAIGDRWGLAHVHEGFARACLYKGRLGDAVSHAERAVLLASAIADPKLTALTRVRLGLAHLARGDVKHARTAVDLALRDAEGCGAEPEIVRALVAVAEVHLELAEKSRAAETAKEALLRALKFGLPGAQVDSLLVLGRAQRTGAEERIAEAATLAERIGNPYTVLDVALADAVVTGDSQRFDAVVSRAAALGAVRHVGEALLENARLWAARNAPDRATPLFMQASAVFAEMGAPLRAEDALRHVE